MACAWCFDLAITAVDEPPQNPVTFAPAVHCGMGATAQSPLVSGAAVVNTPGAQIALGHVRRAPLSRSLFHCGVNIGSPAIVPLLTRPFQYEATFCVAASLMLTDHVEPLGPHHFAPA